MEENYTEDQEITPPQTKKESNIEITDCESKEMATGQHQASKALTNVDYLANLNINSNPTNPLFTGIVCTLGPASESPAMLLEMMENGMRVGRLNCSHADHDFLAQSIDNVRKAARMFKEKHRMDPYVAIALDTKGPEIRTGVVKNDDGNKEVVLRKGNSIIITTEDLYKEACTDKLIWVDYKNFIKVMVPGKMIYFDDGFISIKVIDIGQDYINGVVVNGGKLGSRKGCNLPGTDIDLPTISEKDKADLAFGVEKGVDVVFASFVRDAADVKEIRNFLGKKGEYVWIISKIENQHGLDNIDEIIEESDGIMVARGDLGIEIPLEKVFIAQKKIIAKCNKAGKPVITATQMLKSMVEKHRCTQAEVSDVANAVMDGTDCVMLSSETANGNFPDASVKTMAAIAREAESCFSNETFFADLLNSEFNAGLPKSSGVSSGAVLASHMNQASAIVVKVTSIKDVTEVSKLRPTCPILAVTHVPQLARQLQLCRGVFPVVCQDDEKALRVALEVTNQLKFTSPGDTVITITQGKHINTVSVAQGH